MITIIDIYHDIQPVDDGFIGRHNYRHDFLLFKFYSDTFITDNVLSFFMKASIEVTDLRPHYYDGVKKRSCTTYFKNMSGTKKEIRRHAKLHAAGIMSDNLEITFNDGTTEKYQRHKSLWYKI